MRSSRAAALLLILAGLAAAPAHAAADRSLAFLGVTPGAGFETKDLGLLEETFVTSLSGSGWFTKVTGRSDLATLLGFERMRQLSGCSDSACLAELAGALGVAYVAVADLGRVGDVTVLNLKVMETRTAEAAARVLRRVDREELLLDVVAGVVREAAQLLRERDVRLGRVDLSPPPLALAFVPLGVGQYANRSPVKGTLFLVAQAAAFVTFGVALQRFEASKLPGSGGLFQGGRFEDPAAAGRLQSTYLASFWIGAGLVALGVADALVFRE